MMLTDNERQTLRRHLLGAARVLTLAIERTPTDDLYAKRLIILRLLADCDVQPIELSAAFMIQCIDAQ